METNYRLRSMDLKRIEECALPIIRSYYKSQGERARTVDIEDIMSEVYLKFHQTRNNFRKSGVPFVNWVSLIARNCACDYLRKEKKWDEIQMPLDCYNDCQDTVNGVYGIEASGAYGADYHLISKENVRMINNACDNLCGTTATALKLQGEGYSNKEILKILGGTDGALRTRLSYGRRDLMKNKDIRELRSCTTGNIAA